MTFINVICERFNNSTLVAVFPREPLSYTSTFVSTAGVFTFCTVFTWFLGNALIYIYGVKRKLFKSRTNYNKIGQLQTNISKKKIKIFTFITVFSFVVSRALTAVTTNGVHTRGSIFAGIAHFTLIHV